MPTRVPTIVIEELSVSVGAGAASNANARNFEALGEHKPVVALDEQIARRAGALEGTHHAIPRRISGQETPSWQRQDSR